MNAFFTEQFAVDFAAEWIAAWNARDLDRILKPYARDIEFRSPFVSRLLNSNANSFRGIAVLRVYFGRALNAYPDLHFVSRRVYCGAQSLVLEYQGISSLLAAEMMEFNDAGFVVRVNAHYTAIGPEATAQAGHRTR